MSWVRMMKVLFFFLKRKELHRGHSSTERIHSLTSSKPPSNPPTWAGWMGSEASCRVQQGRHWKLQWCSSSFAFLSRQNCFFSSPLSCLLFCPTLAYVCKIMLLMSSVGKCFWTGCLNQYFNRCSSEAVEKEAEMDKVEIQVWRL